ncbi:hypothetical protein [Streptomyces decoyicus]|uniref:hypothetical protein n=1 Tax=Streptomyces decoyicus TaxID=249567 RepID=UPI00382EE52A
MEHGRVGHREPETATRGDRRVEGTRGAGGNLIGRHEPWHGGDGAAAGGTVRLM